MLFLSPLIKNALYFSAQAHDGQYRKGGKVPYVVHPVLVAMVVSEYTESEEVIAASLLHDVLEDCTSVSRDNVHKEFGESVCALVEEVSFLGEGGEGWEEKKKGYMEKIKSISEDGLLIVAADKMTNIKSYYEALLKEPEKVLSLFKATPEQYRWYYEEVFSVLKQRLRNHPIVLDYAALLIQMK